MNLISGDLQRLALDRANRLLAEAENHRMSRIASGRRPGALDRMAQAIDRGLASVGESLQIDRRPRIPAI